jgi:two-component system NtrC family sensor kinase
VDLLAVARETAELLRAQRRYAGIEIDVAAEAGAPLALADRSAVAQILLNLLLNAGDALAGAEAPRIAVRVRPAAACVREGDGPDDSAARARFDAVECRVSDNGPGIREEDRERVFDPFFTTKEPGEGTGLGLSNALRFAEELGGALELAPAREGEGACFVLRLPVAAEPGAPEGLRKALRTAHGGA